MDFAGVASKIADLLKKGEKNNLTPVMIRDNGQSHYFDLATNQYIYIKKQSEMYYLPIQKTEDDRCYVFLPYVFSSGAIILVPEEELLFIGSN